jgi:hypothetical protein
MRHDHADLFGRVELASAGDAAHGEDGVVAGQKTIDRDRKGSPVVRTPADSPLITNSLVNALARDPTSLAIRFSSSSKKSHSRFAKISGRMYSLYFGASFDPRIEHAASQIHASRDLSPLPLAAINWRRF